MTEPHADQPIEVDGTDLEAASGGIVLVHGRGATARSILDLGRELHRPGIALVAPQAAGNEWYPNSFLAPRESNEPGLSSALEHVGRSIGRLTGQGISSDSILVVGFSQGACLATEYAARHPRRYGGVAALSGGLIGDTVDRQRYPADGSLDGTPAFLGCSDVDPHIPEERVHETGRILEALGAAVETRIYPGMGHGINEDELEYLETLVDPLVEP